jgi:CspA family cold shock protein
MGYERRAATVFSRGIVKMYDPVRGYGFITPDADGEPDLFVHCDVVRAAGLVELSKGDRVAFVVAASQRGPRAVEVSREV